jgi:signal transduction histidine kinase/ligand-binding sensor domain-containing protein/AraC-like DNA-binding protein/AmiR/NasT family two-component response regulator
MATIRTYLLLSIVLFSSSLLYGQSHTNIKQISPTFNNKPVRVFKTTHDQLGNIWMLSSNGILVYDGYYYKSIKTKVIFPNWKENDAISDIITDYNKDIWITSVFGLISKYSVSKGQFEYISLLVKDNISKIISKDESVWLASEEGTIYQYKNSKIDSITTIYKKNLALKNIIDLDLVNPDELFVCTSDGKIFNYSLKSKTTNELIGPFTDYPGNLFLATDKNNRLWIGTATFGLFVYDIIRKEFIQDHFFKKKKFDINKEMFLTLFYDNNGYMWGGTDGGGLYKISTASGEIDLYTKQDSNEFSLSSNTILNINEDSYNNIWVTTNYGKLNVFPNANNNIKYHEGSANNTPLRILSIYKSTQGDIWAGTDGSGLTKIRYNLDGTTNETQYFNNIILNKGFYVQSITEDNQSNIWFGTYKNGLFFHNTKKGTFKKIPILNSKNHEASDISTVFNDSKGRIWVGSNISINVYSSQLNLLASFEKNSNGLTGYIPESFIEDNSGSIWVGIYQGGLFKFNENNSDIKQSTFTNHSYYENKDYTTNGVTYMSLGNMDELWLISNKGKLLKFNTKNKSYSTFDHIESINEQQFSSVIVEDSNNLWLSSLNNGICHLNIKNANLKTYYSTDGLQDNAFLSRSAFKDKQGILYFGGIKGFNFFKPKLLSKKLSYPLLHINSIEILNQPADSLVPSQITSGIHNVESLKLKYNQSSFSFRFSAIDNILDPKYYYAYRLKGFDDNWVDNQPERIATFTNIPPGNYIFEVKAGSKKGIWDIPAKFIAIQIEHPFWSKPTAYIIYLCLLSLFILGIKRWYSLRKNLLLEKISHKKENELHEVKMNFFAKMSHEIQTPITLILGPIEAMQELAEKNGNLLLKQRLNIISNNAKRLSKIARELTLVRDKELNTLRLNVTKNNLFKNIEDITLSFKELARKKKIDFAINCPQNLSDVWYDKEKVEHIVYNLLSNAFKFTPQEGNIQLNINPTNSKKQIKLSVIDSGSGIPKEELEAIFDLFYQTNSGRKIQGSGIGLALTKELIDLHRGRIKVSSKHLEGTIFTIKLPISEDSYQYSEKIITDDLEKPTTVLDVEYLKENQELNQYKKTILIVEDNYDLQTFLKELLENQYNIILAENGEEGFHYAKSNFPDLILSDIMMPKLDGIEMCNKLQKDQLTKHIPVILLTAKNSTNAKISGLISGAIEYINKPFNTKELLLKINNIIISKEYIISKYRKELISNPEIKLNQTLDEVFLENLTSIINSKLYEGNLKIETIADSLNMSYSSLYRKCLSLTGQTLVDFVRLIRLRKGAVLITKYGHTISEVAYMVGFNDPKYFSKCFKKLYGKNPKDFLNEARKTGIDEYLKKHNLDKID